MLNSNKKLHRGMQCSSTNSLLTQSGRPRTDQWSLVAAQPRTRSSYVAAAAVAVAGLPTAEPPGGGPQTCSRPSAVYAEMVGEARQTYTSQQELQSLQCSNQNAISPFSGQRPAPESL